MQRFVNNCQTCIKSKPVKSDTITPPLEPIYDLCNGPEDILEIDLVGELPRSNGYSHILTACDYFSRYLFAIPIRRPDTKSVVDALIDIFSKHAYVPQHIITDKGSAFTSQVIEELMSQAGIQVSHATIKHAQTIGMIERSHQKLKQILKINVSADRPQWDRYVNLAVMAHNTTYHQTLKCTPTEIFHGRVPYNVLDLKFSNPLSGSRNATDVQSLIDNPNSKFKETHANIIKAFHKYKAYYDRKAQASPLKKNDFAFLLNPKINSQSDKIPFNSFKWEGPYKVVKVLSNSNYIVRKVGSFKTQCVHRMRLRPFVPHDPIEDVEDDTNRHYSDPDAIDDQVIFSENLPDQDRTTPTDNVGNIDFNEPEAFDTEHGLIYYEHGQVQVKPRLSNPIPEIMHNETTPQTERENHIPDQNEQAANDVPSPTPPTETKTHNPTKRPQYEIRQLSATLQLNRKDKMLYVPLQFRAYENFGLLDIGAIQSALSEAEFRRILPAHPAALLQELPAPDFKVQIANGSIVPVRKQVLLRFFIGGKVFEETFMVLPTMGNVLIGMSFFRKYSVTLDLANNSEISRHNPPTTLSQREI